jgi:hypothetical protein
MKPYPRSTENLNIVRRVFYYRLSCARNFVENTFGVVSYVLSVEENSTPSSRKG